MNLKLKCNFCKLLKIKTTGKETVLLEEQFRHPENQLVVFWDIETITLDNNEQKAVLISFVVYLYKNGEYTKIKETESSWLKDNSIKIITKNLSNLCKKLNIKEINWWAHNASSFDNFLIVQKLYELDDSLIIKKGDGNELTKLSLKINGIRHNWNDSLKLLTVSLNSLAKIFGVDNKQIFPYKTLRQEWIDYRGEVPSIDYFSEHISKKEYENYKKKYKIWIFKEVLEIYCKNDTELLAKVYIKFIQEIKLLTSTIDGIGVDLTGISTISRASLLILIKFFNKEFITINWQDKKALSFIANATYGGRCEIFHRGFNRLRNKYSLLSHYDVNSMYPYVALKELPISTGFFTKEYTLSREYKAFCYVKVIAPFMKYPILPVKDGDLGNIYPYGTFYGTYYSEELIYAQEHGYIIKVLEAYVIHNSKPVFKNYIEFFYKIKKDNEGVWRNIAKLLLNSLTGKFGQRDYSAKFMKEEPTNKIYQCINISEKKKLYLVQGEEVYFPLNPAITAAITALARIELHKYIVKYQAVYVDTDSFFTEKYIDPMDIGHEIGKLKLVEEDMNFYFHNIKQYLNISNNKLTFKGIKNFTIEDWSKVMDNKKIEKEDYFTKSINNLSIKIDKKIFKVYSKYQKRIINDNTGESLPLEINQRDLKINNNEKLGMSITNILKLKEEIISLANDTPEIENKNIAIIFNYKDESIDLTQKIIKTHYNFKKNISIDHLSELSNLINYVLHNFVEKYEIPKDADIEILLKGY